MAKEFLSKDIPKIVDPGAEEEIDRIIIEYAKKKGMNKDRIPKAFFEN